MDEEHPPQPNHAYTPPTDPHRKNGEPPAALPDDADWRNIVLRGLWLSAAATGVSLVHTFFYYFPRFAPDSSVAPRIGLFTSGAVVVAHLVAIWWFTQPDPGQRASRKVCALRWLAVIADLGYVAILLFRIGWNRDSIAHAVMQVARATVHIPLDYLMFTYLQLLARRMASKKLESAILVLLVGFIICVVFRDWLPWITVVLIDVRWLPDRFLFWPGPIVWITYWAFILVDFVVKCSIAITFRRTITPSTESAADLTEIG